MFYRVQLRVRTILFDPLLATHTLAELDHPRAGVIWNAQQEKIKELIFWVVGAALFGAGITYTEGATKGTEFFAGYLLEESLSVDNLFVFVLIFSYFEDVVLDMVLNAST
ncbi:hypothetical protein CYMTET_18637 [Cymbomonas tetramitiformis]|uniref:Uncharacterized protein n=1 Tax=Cymbomonas tetramitiformis TaxID=36881 RepID=A0AAE0G850_9CHLO|nr:hypothetical protein CYMTET_18637 [Cymbomonas tetramitiformis]